MTSKILVTGAAGFIGSHIVNRLLDEGYDVVGIDNLSNGVLTNVAETNRANSAKDMREFVLNDFASEFILERIRAQEFDVVCHQAALPRVSYSVEHPSETNDINVGGTVRLLDACKGNIKRFIFASSSSVYGDTDVLPTSEKLPKNPKSPYALQKSIIEDYCQLFYRLYELESVCLRYFNVFGPRAKGEGAYATAVAAWLYALKHGTHLRSDGDGEQSRDLCYIDNVVQANLAAITSNVCLNGSVYNIACNDRTTNNEILEYLKKRFKNLEIVHAPERAGDVKHTQADISAARKDLGYEPSVKFWDGLERTIDYMGL